MNALSLPEEIIKAVIDNPAGLANPASFNLSAEQASEILNHGYTKGFRSVFILNASLSAFATLTSIVLIKHKELTRDDDKMRKDSAKQASKEDQADLEKSGEEDSGREGDVGSKAGLSRQSLEETINGHPDTREVISGTSSIASGTLRGHREKDMEDTRN